jgi:hypothetical protein
LVKPPLRSEQLLNWEAIARAQTHPLRLAILEQMQAPPPDGDPGWSAKTLTPVLGASLVDVSYHMRTCAMPV